MTTDKTPATLTVDVLAVMAREIEEARKRVPFMRPEGPQNAEHQREYEEAGDALIQLREARVAVAELIEADIAYDEAMKKRHSRSYLDCAQIKQRRIQQRLTDACHRRNKALARVKGESA